jgi:PAS domain S-box-containing protein
MSGVMKAPINVFDRIVAWSFERRFSAFELYLSAIIAVITVGVVRMLFVPDSLPWLLFIPPIILASLVAGQRLGFFTVIFSTMMGAYSIGDRFNPAFLLEEQWTAASLFLLVGLGLAHLAAELRDAMRRAWTLNGELLESERAVREHDAFLSSVLAASPDCIKVLELDGTLSFMSEGGMKIMGVQDFSLVGGKPWFDLMAEDCVAPARAALGVAREGRSLHFEAALYRNSGQPRWWSVSLSPIKGEDGSVARVLAVSRDHSELKAAHEQQRLLNGELDHRLKNMLATVQSMAGQTLRSAASMPEASAALDARLVSLGRATDVLTATSWQKADLHTVIETGLSATAGCRERVLVDGPAITINAQTALALNLVLHELATNAIKYGALSNETGTVAITWRVEHRPDRDDFSLLWQERGGPTVVQPTRRGFGSRMIERSLAFNVRGRKALSYLPSGVEFRVDAPLADIGDMAPETWAAFEKPNMTMPNPIKARQTQRQVEP